MTTVVGAPESASELTEADAFSVKGYVVALDAKASNPVIGTTVGANTLEGNQLVPMEVWGEGPTSTGRVHSVLNREGNVLVAAANGVFHTVDDKLVVSPASEVLSNLEIRSMHKATGTAEEVLWFVTASALYELRSGTLLKWAVEGTNPEAITALYATDGQVYIGFGPQLYVLDTKAQSATVVDHDFGVINAITGGANGNLQLATEKGVFEQTEESAFTHYTLADGESVMAVDDLAIDPKQGTFAVTKQGVVLMNSSGDAATLKSELPEQVAPRLMAFDDIGNLWVGDDQSVFRMALGSPVSFDADVKPILEKYCMSCHAENPTLPEENAPIVDFLDYDTAVEYGASTVLRISNGQMPPAGKGDPVPPADFEIVKRWQEGGQAP